MTFEYPNFSIINFFIRSIGITALQNKKLYWNMSFSYTKIKYNILEMLVKLKILQQFISQMTKNKYVIYFIEEISNFIM